MKKLLTILLVLVALVLAAAFVGSFFIGDIVKKAVNTVGPQITGTKVEVQSVDVSVFSGACTVKGVTVGNTQEWKNSNAFYLGTLDAKVSLMSLFGDCVVVEKIVIESPEIDYETNLSSSNLKTLLANIEKNTAGDGKAAKQEPTKQPDPAESGQAAAAEKPMKIEIKHFALTGAKVTAVLGEKDREIVVPSIVLENIGTKEGGVEPGQAAAAIVKNLTSQVAKAAAEGATKALKEDPKAVKEAVKDAKKSVKGLFKK